MANTVLTADIIAKESVLILENEMTMANKVYRGYEDDFTKKVNGYKVGASIDVRKPADFTVRDGAVMVPQDTTEGTTPMVVDTQKGVDFSFSSADLTLKIEDLSERVIRPALIQLANQVDLDLHNLYSDVANVAGTPGQLIDSFADFAKGPQLLDEYGVPQDMRCGTLSPADHWALVGSQTDLYNDTINKPAYRKGTTGMVGNVDLYMCQNTATHTAGTRVAPGAVLIDQALTTATTTYAAVKDTNVQTIHVDAASPATATFKKGDTFTIADVYAVNSVTKQPLDFLKTFVVTADATMAAAEGDLIISPALIWTGAHQTVHVSTGVTDLNNKAVTIVQTASTNTRQNMVFHRNAFALCMVPMVNPPGAVDVARRSYKNTSVRVIPVYDGTNDNSSYRLDILYGKKTIDPRLAVRLGGTA